MRRNPPQFLNTPAELPPNLSFVLRISPSAMTLGLGNMRALMRELGHPERAFESVVVAGTNGKGSVTAYLAALLSANGRHVGWFSSPHVYDVNERIRIDNVPVTIADMEAAAARIVPLHDAIQFSYFEALTAIAYLAFAEAGVSVAVLETGLGGRFDATNVVEPVLSVLTSVSLDHRRILGDTEEEILREKLGITRPDTPLLSGELKRELESIVFEKSQRDGFAYRPQRDIGEVTVGKLDWHGTTVHLRTQRCDYGRIVLPFFGAHQAANALLAVGAAEYLLDRVGHFDEARDAVSLPGRFEVHPIEGKKVIVDVAHNDEALIATARTLAELSPLSQNAMILGMLKRKELLRFPSLASSWLRRMYLVDPVPGETMPAPVLFDHMGVKHLRNQPLDIALLAPFDDDRQWDRFLRHLLSADNPVTSLLVTGSFRTVEWFGRHLARRDLWQ